MKPRTSVRRRVRLSLLLVLSAAPLLAAVDRGESPPLDGFDRFVEADGALRFPGPSVRDELVHLGSWFVPEGGAAGFHHVYTQAEAVAAYRATGAWPDGTALVKELRGHRRADYTTGTRVASPTDATQWFVMVKDREGRFPGSPLWREGWGWALFLADDPERNVATDFAIDCQGCHLPARDRDWVYAEGYPRLDHRPGPAAAPGKGR